MAQAKAELPPTTSDELKTRQPRVWWSNALFFAGVHVLCAVGIYLQPAWDVPRATLLLCFASWQLGCFGCVHSFLDAHIHGVDLANSITIGYHRMWSHRAFRGSYPVRVVLAVMGSSATQGSIKVRVVYHLCRLTASPLTLQLFLLRSGGKFPSTSHWGFKTLGLTTLSVQVSQTQAAPCKFIIIMVVHVPH